jgi:hypothetical protein
MHALTVAFGPVEHVPPNLVVGLAAVWRGEKRLTKVPRLKKQIDCYALKINERSRNLGRPEVVSIMRPRHFWFTARQLMLVIALAGAATGCAFGYRLLRRSGDYANKSSWCKLLERSCRDLEAMHLKNATDHEQLAADISALDASTPELSKCVTEGVQKARKAAEQSREAAADCATKAARCAALARKYERAARYPWLGVEPDPTERLPATVTLSSDQNSPPSRK